MLRSVIRQISQKTGAGAFLLRMKNKVWATPTANVDYNREVWDRYAKDWHPGRSTSEDETGATKIEVLGDEWGRKADVIQVLQQFVYPWINKNSVAAEIGSGGGRIASLVVPQVKQLYCFDTSKHMLDKVKETLSAHSNVSYVHVLGRELGSKPEYFDFIYSFDVFVHLDLHTIWKYFIDIERALKPGGKAFLHTSNLTAPEGWRRFQSQDSYNPLGFYFVTPDLIRLLAQNSGFRVVEESQPSAENFYLHRDYMLVIEKPVA